MIKTMSLTNHNRVENHYESRPIMSSGECMVCCEAFTSTVRRAIPCPGCDIQACMSCVKRYLVETSKDACCMNCNVQWTDDHLTDHFPKTWINGEYRKSRTQAMLSEARSNLPEYQGFVDRYKMLGQMKDQRDAVRKRIAELEGELRESKRLAMELDDDLYRTERAVIHGHGDGSNIGTYKGTVQRAVMPCSVEGCNGYVMSGNWSCGVCDTAFCKQCHGVKGEDHECDEDDLKTAEEFRKSTKPCPSCAVPIFKIDGCNQMWCPSCHCCFDWRTLRIETGLVHNPEYFRWLRESGQEIPRNPGDIPGGGCNENAVIGWRELLDATNSRTYGSLPRWVRDAQMALSHIHAVTLPYIRDRTGRDKERYPAVRFLMGEITEKEWATGIYRRVKTSKAKESLGNVIETYKMAANDLLRSLNSTNETSVLKQFDKLVTHMDGAFLRHQKTHKGSLHFVNRSTFKIQTKQPSGIKTL